MALTYSIREGFAAFKRAQFAALAAIIALVIALVLIGVFALLGWAGQHAADYLSNEVGQFVVFVGPEQVDEATARALGDRLMTLPGVRDTAFTSVQEAAATFQADFGEEAEAFGDLSFLPPSWRVRVNRAYAEPDSLEQLAARIETWEHVEMVRFERELLAKVQRNLRVLTWMSLALGLLVVVAALVLVGNTVRLAIYARRLLIRTMKLVGATDSFIRRPFLIEGLMQGAIAGVLAALAVWGLYAALLGTVGEFAVAGWPGGSPVWTIVGVMLTGLGLGWLASFLAVRRFIRQVEVA